MHQKINTFIFTAFVYCLSCSLVFAQTAALLPNALQQYFDNNGNPLTSGTVGFYYPSTLNLKPVWQDSGEVTPWTNPLTLDAGGKPPGGSGGIYGQGVYRQIVKDASGNLIWDAVTSSLGTGSLVTGTGDGDLVGTVKPWAGIQAPNQYMFAYGEQISRTIFSVLFAAITQSTNVTCASSSNTLSGIADTTQIRIGGPVEVSCMPAGTTVISKTSSTIVASNTASTGLNTIAVFFPFGNGDGSTTFTLPDFRGNVIAGRPNMGGTASTNLTNAFCANPTAQGAVCGAQSEILAQANLPNVLFNPTFTGTPVTPIFTGSNNLLVAFPAGTPAGNLFGTSSAGQTPPTGTISTITPAGTVSGIRLNGNVTQTALTTIQPTIVLNYIIKVTQDINSAISSGVTSLGSMTGDIACGNGLLCTGNVISVTGGAGGSAGGANTQVQINQSGIFGASANLTFVSPTLTIGASGTSGNLSIAGSGSGNVTQTVQATAGTSTIIWGNTSGTPAVTATLPLQITTANGNIACLTCGITTNPLSQFASTTSAQLAGILSDETGTGTAVFSTSPTLITPVLGVASATSINGLTLTSSTGTFTLTNGKVFSVANSLALAGVDSTTITFQGTDTYIGRATTDILTNKTFDTAGTGNVFKINGTQITAIGGNTAKVGTVAGSLISGDCVSIDANLNFVDAGGACTTGGGGGTVTAGTAGQLGYYGSSGTTVSGNPNATIVAGALTLGIGGSIQGSLKFAGVISGTTTLAVATAASGTLTLPSTTDTIVAKNTTDVLTNKTINTATGSNVILFDTANAGNSFKIAGTAITSISGNTAKLASINGTLTNNDCASFDVSGNVIDSGAACNAVNIPFVILPQGRLTLTSNTPVMLANATSGTIYYDCYNGGSYVSYYSGSIDTYDKIGSCQVSTVLVDGAVTTTGDNLASGGINNNAVYDIWWVHGGANRICVANGAAASHSGGGWASDTGGSNTARGTGYSQLDKTTRPYITNANSITNCWNGSTDYGPVSANQATYLGTFYSTSVGQTKMQFVNIDVSSTPVNIGIWNAYNRVSINSRGYFGTSTWTVSSAVVRQWNNNANAQFQIVSGIAIEGIGTSCTGFINAALTSSAWSCGIGLDTTTAFSGYNSVMITQSAGAYVGGGVTDAFSPQIGYHILSLNENTNNTTLTVNGGPHSAGGTVSWFY